MKYRAEVDGLRFIAVFIVIIYHIRLNILDVNFFKGGFVGVDVFFVISGYLITNLIKRDIELKQFSILNFFERRIRRILPLLLFVSLIFLIFGSILLYGEDLVIFANTVLSSVLFYSNYFFLFNDLKYGADTTTINPFIHTWSLSIEEQYYILFPLLIITLKKNLDWVKILIILLFIISFILCLNGNSKYPSSNFYMFSSRIWEILMGALIAFAPIKDNHNKIFNNLLPIIGLLLILLSSFYFNDIDENFPSYKNIYPTLGTLLILLFCNSKDIISKLLSFKIFVYLGKISFSLYLIHVPILSIIRKTEIIEPTILNKFIVIVFIFIFSVFTYHFIEKKFRNIIQMTFRKCLIYLGIFYGLIFLLIIILNNTNGQILKYDPKYQNLLLTMEKNDKYNLDNCIDQDLIADKDELDFFEFRCSFNEEKKQKIILIGDSFMINLAEELLEKYNNYNYQIYITSGCFYSPGFNKHNRFSMRIDELCSNKNFQKIKKILMSEEDSVIVFNQRIQMYLEGFYFGRDESKWDYLFLSDKLNGELDTDELIDEFKQLSTKNKVFLVYPTPELDFNPISKISNLINKSKFKELNVSQEIKELGMEYYKFKSRSEKSINFFDKIESDLIFRIYPEDFLCDKINKKICYVVKNNNVLYEDDNHLSNYGASIIAKEIDRKIKIFE